MSPFDRWWNESEHSEAMDCIDSREVARDAWDAACANAIEILMGNDNA